MEEDRPTITFTRSPLAMWGHKITLIFTFLFVTVARNKHSGEIAKASQKEKTVSEITNITILFTAQYTTAGEISAI